MSLLITFEGGEGTGKSTQAALLAEKLRAEGRSVVLTREPGGSEGAESIRALLVNGAVDRWSNRAETLLMWAARIDHWEKTMAPALKEGAIVICDRFIDSTVAYQGYGKGIDLNFLDKIHEFGLPDVYPHLTFVFDLPPDIGVKRALSRHASETRFEHMDVTIHHRIREGYQAISFTNPGRCHVIQADQNIDQIADAVYRTVQKKIQDMR